MIRVILFDLDNTLLDREAAFRGFAEKLADAYADTTAAGREAWINRVVTMDEDGYKSRTELFREIRAVLPCLPAASSGDWDEFYRIHYVGSAALMQGAQELLAALWPYYRLGIITNGVDEIQNGAIDRLGIRHWFQSVTVSESAGYKKPSPQIFSQALQTMRSQPEQTLFVGDHPVNDVEGALLSGMRAVWFRRSQPWLESISMLPDAVIAQLSELPKAIRSVWGQTALGPNRLLGGA